MFSSRGLDLFDLGFERVAPKRTGRPAYAPVVLLKLYITASRASRCKQILMGGKAVIRPRWTYSRSQDRISLLTHVYSDQTGN